MSASVCVSLALGVIAAALLAALALAVETPRANGARAVLRCIMWPIVLTRLVWVAATWYEAIYRRDFDWLLIGPHLISIVALCAAIYYLRRLHSARRRRDE